MNPENNLAKQNIEAISGFLERTESRAGGKRFLVGLSGGIDSVTLAYTISQRFGKEKLDTYTITGDRIAEDYTNHATYIGNKLSNHHTAINLTDIFNPNLVRKTSPEQYAELVGQAVTYMTNEHKESHRTLTPGNLCEKAAGLTCFGAFLGEFAPYANFMKSEIYGMAHELKVPSEVIDRVPGSDIEGTPTDEELAGVPFPKLEAFLLNVSILEKDEYFALQYSVTDKEGLRNLCCLSREELSILELRLLDSARFWITEGPKSNKTTIDVYTDDIHEPQRTGGLFRPETFSMFPGRDKSNQIGIIPAVTFKGEDNDEIIKNIRDEYYPKETIILLRDESVNLPEIHEGGIKLTTVKRGDWHSRRRRRGV